MIVPAFYSFPHVAKLLSLSFVLFAAWYSDTVLTLAARAQLALAGLVSLFGSLNSAIPFLLDLVRVPADTFQLFLATGVLNSRFGTLAAAMHMVVLALAGTYALVGKLIFSPVRILRYGLVTAGATAGTLAVTALLLRATGVGTYDKDQVALSMQPLRPPSQKAVVLRELPTEPLSGRVEGVSVMQAVRGARTTPRGLHRRGDALQLPERPRRAGRFRRGDGPHAGGGARSRAGVRPRAPRAAWPRCWTRSVRRGHVRGAADHSPGRADGLTRRTTSTRRSPSSSPTIGAATSRTRRGSEALRASGSQCRTSPICWTSCSGSSRA